MAALLPLTGMSIASAQSDPVQDLNQAIRENTNGEFGFTFEERTRWEEKDGVSFGKAVNRQDMLSRLRIGADFTPVSWFTISAMGQDTRAPFYGANAPNSIRDTMDLQEGYIELFRGRKTGFGAILGRQMLNLGDSRIIGSPQWSSVSRTFDTGRLYYRTVNKNKIGGWTGTGTLGTDTFGGRIYGPLPGKFAYDAEGMGQIGHSGLRAQRAFAYFAGASRKTTVLTKPLNFSGEYKVASGTGPGSGNSGTFDQLSPANHDKFGQEDLFRMA